MLLSWWNKALRVIIKGKDNTQDKSTKKWQQSGICDCNGKKTAKVDTMTIQNLYVQIAVLMLHRQSLWIRIKKLRWNNQ